MNNLASILTSLALAVFLAAAGCGREGGSEGSPNGQSQATHTDDHDHDHDHDHGDHDHDEVGHDHDDEIPLGTTTIGDIEVEAAQGHGEVEPGKEMHLVVKLPYNDNGATIVRAWIGTEDRFASLVAKAEYSASHDDYDLHAIAPDPLPEGAKWWIEIEKPDGTKVVGSAKPITE